MFSKLDFVGKRANLKAGVTRKQSTPNFSKNGHFLPLDTHSFGKPVDTPSTCLLVKRKNTVRGMINKVIK